MTEIHAAARGSGNKSSVIISYDLALVILHSLLIRKIIDIISDIDNELIRQESFFDKIK